VKQYKTLENVYDNMDEISGKKLKENLTNYQNEAFMSKELVTINRESPIKVTIDDVLFGNYDRNQVRSIFKDLGFQSLLTRVPGESDDDTEKATELAAIDYTIATEITADMFTGEAAIVIEMLRENYHNAPIEGIGIVNENDAYFVPTTVAVKSQAFKEWAEDRTKKKYVFDAKKTLVALLNHDINIQGITFDMLLASYLLNTNENHHDIPAIGHRMGNNAVLFDEEVYGKGAKLKVPEQDILADHVVRKTSLLFNIKSDMEEQLKNNEQYELFRELEMPLALILGEMEHTGVQVDIKRLENMGTELKKRLDEIEKEVYELAGEQFNLN
jgi:DNA polymerase-1